MYPNSQPRDSTLRPTRDFPRQDRYKQVEDIWKYVHQHRADLRKPLPYFYGTSGSGKTTVLKYVAECSEEDMENLGVELPSGGVDRTLADWARSVKVMSVSFNSDTPITAFDKKLLERELYLAAAVVRLLFYQQSQETNFEKFSKQLRKACQQDTTGFLREQLDDFDN